MSTRPRQLHFPHSAILLFAFCVFAAACGYQGSLGEIACDDAEQCPENADCIDGLCVYDEDEEILCDDDQTACDGECVDLLSDDEHCGSCRNDCFESESCVQGSCIADDDCAQGLTFCGGQCVNLDDDDGHCGSCSNTCEGQQYCQGGQCHCPGQRLVCDGECVDTQVSSEHCGGCGNACGEDEFCFEGTCSDECDETQDNQQWCDDVCVNPLTNPNFCGDCDTECDDIDGATTACIDGHCDYECDDGSAELCLDAGLCATLDDDPDHCGDCERRCEPVTGASRGCDGGHCDYLCDDADFGYCGGGDPSEDTGLGECIDLTESIDHCQSCDNACPTDGPTGAEPICTDQGCSFECSGASTFCSADQEGVDTDICADLQSDDNHCGSCGNACPSHQYCDAGSCTDLPCDPSPEPTDPHYPFGGGEGTPSEPYLICSPQQLSAIDSEASFLSAYFALGSHIELGGIAFEPIARATGNIEDGWTDAFTGHFDGNGYEIRDLHIDTGGTTRAGLFGVVDGGTLTGVVVVDGSVQGGQWWSGGLAAISYGRISNSSFQGSVAGQYGVGGLIGGLDATGTVETSHFEGSVQGVHRVGGAVGHNGGTIDEVSATADVTGSDTAVGGLVGYQRHVATIAGGHVGYDGVDPRPQVVGTSLVGGLIGRNDGTIMGSTSHADVTGDGEHIGGLVGDNNDLEGLSVCSIDDSHATGSVVAIGNSEHVGGLVGNHLYGCSIEESTATGTVDAADSSAVGGLVGWSHSDATIVESFATGDVTGHHFVGGLAGRVSSIDGEDWYENQAPVSSSYAQGEVSGTDSVGGLVGRLEGTIVGSHATGVVDGVASVGGLVGHNRITFWGTYGTVVDSFAEGDVHGVTEVGGLVGLQEGEVLESHASGDVTGTDRVGGLVGDNPLSSGGNTLDGNGDWVAGWSKAAAIDDSYAAGAVEGSTLVGGLVGFHDGQLHRGFAVGDVTGLGDGEEIGGLAGRVDGDGAVFDSYATGNITGIRRVGGLVGRIRSKNLGFGPSGHVENSYSIGTVTASGDSVGELIGESDGDVVNSYWRSDTPDDDESDGGEPLSTAEFTDSGNFINWDFNAIWEMGSQRPHLQNLPEP